MSRNTQTIETYLDGFRKNDHAQILFVMRDGKIAERRAWVVELKENDHR
ncbi:hypothetical protein AB0L34_08180 [Micromonospora sp. NPDC052213]